MGVLLDWCIGLITGAIILTLFAGVILRYIFNAPLFWAEEIVVLGLIWMTFLGGIVLVRDDKNVAITAITDALPQKLAKVVCFIADLLVLGIIGVMVWLSWTLTGRLGMSTTPALRISESWYGAAMFIGFVGMLFFQLQRVAGNIFKYFVRSKEGKAVGGEA